MRTPPALLTILVFAGLLAAPSVEPLDAQGTPGVFGPKRPPFQTQRFENLARGPSPGW